MPSTHRLAQTALLLAVLVALAHPGVAPAQPGDAGQATNLALGRPALASSFYYQNPPGKLVDGTVVGATGSTDRNMWQTECSAPVVCPSPPPAGQAWWSVDLGGVAEVSAIRIAFADWPMARHYGVPKTIVVEARTPATNDDPCGGPVGAVWEAVRTITMLELPVGGTPNLGEFWSYALPAPVTASAVRLRFPDGNQRVGSELMAANAVALSEVEVIGSGLREEVAPATPSAVSAGPAEVVLEGGFGRAAISTRSPEMTDLRLRDEASGALSPTNMLATEGGWRSGGYSYVVQDVRGSYHEFTRRFESRLACPSPQVTVERDAAGAVRSLSLEGIRPRAEGYTVEPVEEDWTLGVLEDGSLEWTIEQRWLRDMEVTMSGTPGIFLGPFGQFLSGITPGDSRLTSTYWYNPERISIQNSLDCRGYFRAGYGAREYDRNYTTDVCSIIQDAETFATFKLFTNYHEASDLRLEVAEAGRIFRRGGTAASFNEVGAVADPELFFRRTQGETTTAVLRIDAVDKHASGQQLQVDLPDEATEANLRDLYGSMLNGGAVANHRNYDMTNQSEDGLYTGSSWMQSYAVSAGVLGAQPLSGDPAMTPERSIRDKLGRILSTVDEEGLTHYGFYPPDENGSPAIATDGALSTLMGVHAYAVHSGDRDFVTQRMPEMHRMTQHFLDRIDPIRGLYRAGGSSAAWYYDAINYSGFNGYYQAFLYRSLVVMGEMSEWTGAADKAAEYRDAAARLKDAINRELWMPIGPEVVPGLGSPGGGRGAQYADWIDDDGNKHAYFIDLVQYPMIEFGIASDEQAQAMLDTADARMTQLVAENGYTREGSLTLLWPLAAQHNKYNFPFGTYMNGGSLPAMSYWEIAARARMGRVDGEFGAYRLLQRFAAKFGRDSFIGNNTWTMRGAYDGGTAQEPFLSDAIATPSVLVRGIFGVQDNLSELDVRPALPSSWAAASATVQHLGQLYRIEITNGEVHVSPILE